MFPVSASLLSLLVGKRTRRPAPLPAANVALLTSCLGGWAFGLGFRAGLSGGFSVGIGWAAGWIVDWAIGWGVGWAIACDGWDVGLGVGSSPDKVPKKRLHVLKIDAEGHDYKVRGLRTGT